MDDFCLEMRSADESKVGDNNTAEDIQNVR